MADTDSTLDVQRAVVAALEAGVTYDVPTTPTVVETLPIAVYDRVPQGAAFPYIRISDALGQPAAETISGEGFEVVVTLHIWSRAQSGMVQALQIAAQVVDTLNNSTLNLMTGSPPSGKTVVMTRLLEQRTRREDDVTTQVIQRWQFITDG